MPRIKNQSVPIAELAQGLAGKTLSDASKSSSGGANYITPRTIMAPLATGTSSGIVLAVQNPESYPLIIRQVSLVVQTPGQTSCSIDIGIVASSSKSASDIFNGAAAGPPGTIGAFHLPVGYTPVGGSGSSGLHLSAGGVSVWEKNGNSSDAWLTGKLILGTGSSLAGYALIEVVPFHSS